MCRRQRLEPVRTIVPENRDRRTFKNGFGICPGNGDLPLQQQVQMQTLAGIVGKIMTPAQSAGVVDTDARHCAVDQRGKSIQMRVRCTHVYDLQSLLNNLLH